MTPSETMNALVLTDAGPQYQSVPVPAIGQDEALIRVRLAGVCSTDLEIAKGYKGGFRGVMGHEFVGEVAQVGRADNEGWLGKRVVGEINIGCGACNLCRRRLGKHCVQRAALGIFGHDGVFAEYFALPVANLHAVPNGVPDEVAVFCEPLAAALEIGEQLHIGASQRIYVIGDGRLGLLVAMALQRTGAEITLLGRTQAKLALAAQAGIAVALTSDLARFVDSPADIVVEVTGSPEGWAMARQLVRPMGTIVLKSTYAGALERFDASALVVDEITLVGSRCGPFAPALRLLEQGAIDPRPMIHARFPLMQGVEALEYARARGVLKVLIEP